MGQLLPQEGWLNLELHCHLDGVGPSDRHPDLAQVLLSVPPPEEPSGCDPRADVLADYISRVMEMGAGLEEIETELPGRGEQYRHLAEALVPWLVDVPRREVKDAWNRGYETGRRRADGP
ncbi:hypothetical protein [Streptomyces sp. NRRL S-146]|uniref:hypothetical protein n=1 Tax=Streptomyces sp. NRRL S-146 TaxID=1463884 RepID=UPI0004C80849|nr:hypothetical protein [Streptomyces sp. NRRL S-146]